MLNRPRRLDQVRDRIRVKRDSLRTEPAYIQWIKRFIFFHGKRHPKGMAAPDVEAFLSPLATEKNVSVSMQSQALSALLFLCREVLGIELPWLENLTRAKKPTTLSGRSDRHRSEGGPGPTGWAERSGGQPVVRCRSVIDGSLAASCQGLRFRDAADHGRGWQGLQRSLAVHMRRPLITQWGNNARNAHSGKGGIG